MTPEERDRLTRLEEQVRQFADDMREVRTDVKKIASLMDQTKGGWTTLLWVGGLAGAVGAALAKFSALLGVAR
jgi:hypothetical protein